MPEIVWITWENQVRNKSLSARLGAELHILLSGRSCLARYAVCSWKSLSVIWKRRPSVVFAPNPSLVLAYLLMLLKHLFRFRFVIDAHYAGIVAPNGNRLFQKALDYCNRRADLVIVTNEEHCRHVEAVGGRAMVCEDPLPDIGQYAKVVGGDSKDIFFICSFDIDEPYADVFDAARILKQDGYVFCVSGNFGKAGINPSDWPQVLFMGYVPESEYYEHMAKSQVVVDLTEQQNCLVCGAYEAMVLEKPLVTSNTSALKNYFNAGTVFVDHKPEAIAEGIRVAYETKDELKRQIVDWTRRAAVDNTRKIEAIRALLNLPGQDINLK